MSTGSFPEMKSGRSVTLTPHPLLVPWSWKGRPIPLLPLWAVRPVQNLSPCTRVHFTFFTYEFFRDGAVCCCSFLQLFVWWCLFFLALLRWHTGFGWLCNRDQNTLTTSTYQLKEREQIRNNRHVATGATREHKVTWLHIQTTTITTTLHLQTRYTHPNRPA